MKQAVLLLSIALCVCAATAAQNAVSTTSLMDSIITPKASTMSGYRYGVERETMCFRTTNLCTVEEAAKTANETFVPKFTVDDIICTACPQLHHGGDYYGAHHDDGSFIAEVTPTLSKCIIQEEGLGTPVQVANKKEWSYAGTYTAMCYLEDDTKSGCKFPDTCEDTMVAIQGLIYEVPAVRLGQENTAPSDACDPWVASRKVAAKAPAKAAPQQPAGKAGIQASKDHSEDEKMVKVGRARVYSGTGTLHAGHVLKFKTVHHQYSVFTTDSDDFVPTPLSDISSDTQKLGDKVHKFDFVGEAKPHY